MISLVANVLVTYTRNLLLLLELNPLERCCVYNMSPFVSNSGLSPGSREVKVQRAKVCLNCTEPTVASFNEPEIG